MANFFKNQGSGLEHKIVQFSLVNTIRSDASGLEYSYGPGGKYNTRAEAVQAVRQAGLNPVFGENYGKAIERSRQETFLFTTNPSNLSISQPTTTIRNEFLGRDGGLVRATQLGFKTFTGSGTMLSTINLNPLESFERLTDAQKRKQPLEFFGGDIKATIIIESLSVNLTPRTNAVDFSFAFIETYVQESIKTGFEYDKTRKRENTAIEGIRFRPTAIETAEDIAGDSDNPDKDDYQINITNALNDALALQDSGKEDDPLADSVPSWRNYFRPEVLEIVGNESPYKDLSSPLSF
jgi:hypothetical protein